MGEESSEPGRIVLHSRAGGIGADWDLAAVLGFIGEAEEVGFGFSLLGHEMYVVNGGRQVNFDVKAPTDPDEIEKMKAAGFLVEGES
jgi:hypothetical protein